MSTTEVKITTANKSVTIKVIDEAELTVDMISGYLVKNYYASILANSVDNTPTIPKSIKDLLIKEVEKK
jgi:hypothetical protein